MIAKLGAMAVKAAMSMAMSLITEEFFKDIFMWAAEKAVNKTKWKWDDELFNKIKEQVED